MKALSIMGRAAHAYGGRFKWKIFPLKPGTKEPHSRFVRHGFLEATCDPEQIDRWYSADPTAGIGLACAASGLVVLDADLYKDDCGFRALEAQLGELPHTVRQLTPQGGVHYLFRDQVGGGYQNPCTGAEAKHEGYIVLAPSVHPNGSPYRWDLGAHPLETEIATLPDAWLRHVTTPKASKGGAVLPSSGTDAADSWLGVALGEMGMLGIPLDGGKRAVRCPWVHEHSDGRGDGQDSSAVLFPRSSGKTLGGFRCSHSHCDGRGWRDVVAIVTPRAKYVADEAMRRERNRITLEQIEKLRKAVGW